MQSRVCESEGVYSKILQNHSIRQFYIHINVE